MQVVVGGLLQESNTFSEAESTLADFKRYFYLTGEELLKENGTKNELSGFCQAASEQQVTLLPTLYAQACSGGKIRRKSLDELKRQLMAHFDNIPAYDGVLFALHGAWAADDNDDADGEIVCAIREKIGPTIPLVITLDSHANVTRTIVANVNGIVAYRTFPHSDYAETGYRAAQLLFALLREEVESHLCYVKLPMITPAEAHRTDEGPMFELWREAAAGERSGQSLVTSLFAVQPWLDVDELGFSAVVMGRSKEQGEAEVRRLGNLIWSKRKQFNVTLYSVRQIVDFLYSRDKPTVGPIVVSDSADSPGAGSPGDSNAVLRDLLELGAESKFTCLLSMVDAPAARKAIEAGVGSTVRLQVGHSVSTAFGAPLEIEGVVDYATESGIFVFGGGTVANLSADMGCCAVVCIGGIKLLLMENPTFTGDPAMYRSVGLEPLDADLVLVKSAAQFRAEYGTVTDRIYFLDTPGASTANLASLTFTRIQRPMYPFDTEAPFDGSPHEVEERWNVTFQYGVYGTGDDASNPEYPLFIDDSRRQRGKWRRFKPSIVGARQLHPSRTASITVTQTLSFEEAQEITHRISAAESRSNEQGDRTFAYIGPDQPWRNHWTTVDEAQRTYQRTYTSVEEVLQDSDSGSNALQAIPCDNLLTEAGRSALQNELKTCVRTAGFGTRAGVVAAAKYLAVDFPFDVTYVSGNGGVYHDGVIAVPGTSLYRLNCQDGLNIDSETTGWGCLDDVLYQHTENKVENPAKLHGTNCSSFVYWAINNGGFDLYRDTDSMIAYYQHTKYDFNKSDNRYPIIKMNASFLGNGIGGRDASDRNSFELTGEAGKPLSYHPTWNDADQALPGGIQPGDLVAVGTRHIGMVLEVTAEYVYTVDSVEHQNDYALCYNGYDDVEASHACKTRIQNANPDIVHSGVYIRKFARDHGQNYWTRLIAMDYVYNNPSFKRSGSEFYGI
ncbi:M81 family metallopeptidase [Paenibacillus koleovorans]|uniref:M81 family metallopeptidase n=1 Tax=Paenibacillus koleovorans TaxID=121608 RepID=UPI000FD9D663|nr:M81 family metallopeptidase [Paenibacillus koleovorans]